LSFFAAETIATSVEFNEVNVEEISSSEEDESGKIDTVML
jgi:hypothetical protein